MTNSDLNSFTSSEGLRDYGIKYLLDCGFVDALVKKTIYHTDIDDLYEDYLGETWLAILELKDEKWCELYRSSIKKGVEYEYEIRNFISRLIYNTCHSQTSNAYRKLKKRSTKEKMQDEVKWNVLENTILDEKGITDYIRDYD